MWLVYREETDGCRIMHGRNGLEYRLPELSHLSADGFCAENRMVYEFCGCYWTGHACLSFRDVGTMAGDTLTESFEQTMARLGQIMRVGHHVEVQWECEFENEILVRQPELKMHPVIEHEPLKTRDALYGGRTEAMRIYYKIREGESIQYCDIVSLYPYICKYFKFPVEHLVLHVGDAHQDKEAMLRKEGLM